MQGLFFAAFLRALLRPSFRMLRCPVDD